MVQKPKRRLANLKNSSQEFLVSLKNLLKREETFEQALELQDEFSIKSNLLSQLPADYLKAFEFSPVKNKDFFVGRSRELEELENACQRFREGKVCSVSITGEKGSGKSSFLNVSQELFRGYKVIRCEVTKTLTTSEELVDFFARLFKQKSFRNIEDVRRHLFKSDKVIVILEGCHNFFIRVIGGFEALKDLLTLISITNTRVLWTLTFNKFASDYLNKVVNLRNYFEYNIELGPLSAEETEEMIGRRNGATHYAISFVPPDEQLKKYMSTKNAKKREELQIVFGKRYFNRVANVASGNPYVILFYWLNSLKRCFDIMFAFEVQNYSFSFLREMNNQRVLALPLLLEHESLSLKQISKVMTAGLSETRRMTDLFVKKNILVYESSDDIYVLNPLYVKPIRDFLTTKNLVS